MCSAWRFCLSVYLSLSPLGIIPFSSKDAGGMCESASVPGSVKYLPCPIVDFRSWNLGRNAPDVYLYRRVASLFVVSFFRLAECGIVNRICSIADEICEHLLLLPGFTSYVQRHREMRCSENIYAISVPFKSIHFETGEARLGFAY